MKLITKIKYLFLMLGSFLIKKLFKNTKFSITGAWKFKYFVIFIYLIVNQAFL